jgi:hypothetical protein
MEIPSRSKGVIKTVLIPVCCAAAEDSGNWAWASGLDMSGVWTVSPSIIARAKIEARVIGLINPPRGERNRPMRGHEPVIFAVCPPNSGVTSVAQARRIFGNNIEHGLILVGELAITPSISLVAVCCSNDSFSSWNNRTFSMAMIA